METNSGEGHRPPPPPPPTDSRGVPQLFSPPLRTHPVNYATGKSGRFHYYLPAIRRAECRPVVLSRTTSDRWPWVFKGNYHGPTRSSTRNCKIAKANVHGRRNPNSTNVLVVVKRKKPWAQNVRIGEKTERERERESEISLVSSRVTYSLAEKRMKRRESVVVMVVAEGTRISTWLHTSIIAQ